jgi:hypothetical protein
MLVPLSQSALTEAGSVATTVHVGAALSRKSIITNVTLTWFEEGRPKRVGLAARLGRACEAGMAALILLAWRGKCISRRTGGGLVRAGRGALRPFRGPGGDRDGYPHGPLAGTLSTIHSSARTGKFFEIRIQHPIEVGEKSAQKPQRD